MSLKTIILRSNQVNPDSRVEKEVAALAEHGCEVAILAWDRRSDHPARKDTLCAFGYKVPIIRFGHKANFGDGFMSLKQYLLFQFNLFSWLIKNKNEYDVIHACDFDTAFTATIANIFLKKKFIFDIFDYIGGERHTKLQRILCHLQNWIINRASATIICSEDRKKQISQSKPKRTIVIHNSPPKLTIKEENNLKSPETVKICYVGILQDYRLLNELAEFFKSHPEYEFHIGGFGKYEKLYKDLSENYRNIHYYGRLQYEDTLKLEIDCDIMLAIYDPSIENHVFAAPNKFYEALMIGRPLVMVKGTGMSDVIAKHNLGVTIEYNIDSFERGIKQLIEQRDAWPDISSRMKDVYENYSWDEMKPRLWNLYDSL